MKRMYIVLAVIIFIMVGTVGAISQIISSSEDESRVVREPFDRHKRRMELREQMHRRMRDKLLHGLGPDQDLFKDLDKAFEEAMSDSFSIDMPQRVANFKSHWSETAEGRVLTITPQSKDQKLNIDVNEASITIKGESVQKTATTSITSSFNNTFPVPGDVDGRKVKILEKDGNLLVVLPFREMKKVTKPSKEERKPLSPIEGDIEI